MLTLHLKYIAGNWVKYGSQNSNIHFRQNNINISWIFSNKKLIQLTSSSYFSDENKLSNLNVFLSCTKNDSTSLKLNLFPKIWEKWYLTDETKSFAFLTNKREQSLHWLIKLGELLQKSKWNKTFVMQNPFFKILINI